MPVGLTLLVLVLLDDLIRLMQGGEASFTLAGKEELQHSE
jgi:hypothetical protein